MPYLTTDDGVRLYYEEAGIGNAIVFVHEFAGDLRSYEPQLRHFSRRYRCVAYNARGYPPSDVPADLTRYSQDRARDDIKSVIEALGLERPHIVGVSMGAFATLHFGLNYPDRARSLVVGGCGYGAEPAKRAQFQAEAEAAAQRFETLPIAQAAERYSQGPGRMQLRDKDPRGFAEFVRNLAEHSSLGSALTLRGVQKMRPSLYEMTDRLSRLTVPTLVMVGDEDESCLEPAVMLKRTMLAAGLAILPRTGHALNLEEAVLFNVLCDDFFHQVESGRWPIRETVPGTGKIL
ncbi:MAG TPA: alpha/beta hydrolase [Candidatus Binataceae bacterium]|nr:alpha/beta hydrolase [Candidatus Binataceae bacterium]